jgi:Ca2+-binding RTX toxin-like protein
VTSQLRQVLLSAKVGIGFSIFIVGALVLATSLTGSSNACFNLSGGKGFSITSIVTAYPACSGATVDLYPGVERCLVYTAHNPLTVPLTVGSLNVVTVTLATQPRDPALPACTASQLDLSKAGFSGSLPVPPLGTASVAERLTFIDTSTNQDNCEDATFNFVYSGAATYVDTTTTVLTSSPTPSKVGQVVTFMASVSATGTPPSKPTGTVSFYLCASVGCASPALLGSANLGGDGRASYSTAGLAAGAHLVEAVYKSPAREFAGSTSALLSQVVRPAKYPTVTAVAAFPDPAAWGSPVVISATVAKSSASGIPAGAVSFYAGTPSGPHTLLGTTALGPNARASLSTSGLPTGTNSLYAVYAGDTNFTASTSPVVGETVVAPPSNCKGNYHYSFTGIAGVSVISGTNQADFIYAFGGDYTINGLGGNDCVWAGGGSNVITDGNGDDVVLAGNGHDVVLIGNGIDTVALGNGDADAITSGNGDDNVSVGDGHDDVVNLGNGTDIVTLMYGGSHDTINGGRGDETIYLGAGTYNTYNDRDRSNTCHVPAPPTSWHGTPGGYYHDTLTGCTVVTS